MIVGTKMLYQNFFYKINKIIFWLQNKIKIINESFLQYTVMKAECTNSKSDLMIEPELVSISVWVKSCQAGSFIDKCRLHSDARFHIGAKPDNT